MFPGGQNSSQDEKILRTKFINSFLAHKLSYDRWFCFFCWVLTGPYPMLRFGGACRLGWGHSNKRNGECSICKTDFFQT